MGPFWHAPANNAYQLYERDDRLLRALAKKNLDAFTVAVQAGQGGAAYWEIVFPAAGAVLLAALVLAGVRPRLAEYH